MAGKGILFIISAPSGAGKTTLFKMALEKFDDIQPSISYTTRPKRLIERSGSDYFFVSDHIFDSMIKEDKFIEWANVHKHKYGTPREFIESSMESGQDILFDIDVQGARNIKRMFPESTLIFILPPSFRVLKERLMGRNTDRDDDVSTRLEDAINEIKCINEFDYLIVNDDLMRAYEELMAIITVKRLMRDKNNFKIDEFLNN